MRSLDGLIKFLLEEIALCGDKGASVKDFLHYIDLFYSNGSDEQNLPRGLAISQSIDRAFQEQVWKWLSRHPDIRVGRDGKANGLNLSQAEAFVQRHTVSSPRAFGQDDYHAQTESTTVAEGTSDSLAKATSSTSDQCTLRIYSSPKQMWLAVAGHGPDNDKVQRLDFQCLMAIASCRENGILQTDLIRVTGQDKRSVPPRTQRLYEHGYISKVSVTAKAARTSMLFLRRFAPKEGFQPTSSQTSFTNSHNPLFKYSKFKQIEDLLQRALDLIREHRIMIWNDLKRKLDIMVRPAESKLLAQAVRRLELIGCLQRVRAAGALKLSGKIFHRCVKLLREPKEEDWQTFFDPRTDFALKSTLNDEDLEETVTGGDEDYQIDNSIIVDDSNEESVRDCRSIVACVPRWVPDRPLGHVVYDVAFQGGTKGVTLSELKEQAVGGFFSRPIELLVGRLVDFWQVSQPIHLRHLALVRDAAQTGKIGFYIHYTYNSFKSKVENQEAVWESIQTMSEPGIELSADEHGFPSLEASRFCGISGTMTLAECIKAARVQAFGIVKNIDGATLGTMSNAVRPRGRPRKYPPKTKASLVQGGKAYLPSTAGHTLITPIHSLSSVGASQGKAPGPPARGSVSSATISTAKKRVATKQVTSTGNRPAKQKKTLSSTQNLETRETPVKALLPRVSNELTEFVHSNVLGTRKDKRKRTIEARDEDDLTIHEAPKKLRRSSHRESQTYDQQLHAIDRPTTGTYIGALSAVKTRRGRPPKSRLAVFKSPRLISMAFFANDTPSQALSSTLGSLNEASDSEQITAERDANSLDTDDGPSHNGESVSGTLRNQISRQTNEVTGSLVVHAQKRKRSSLSDFGREAPLTQLPPLDSSNNACRLAMAEGTLASLQSQSNNPPIPHDESVGDNTSDLANLTHLDKRSSLFSHLAASESATAHSLLLETTASNTPRVEHPDQSSMEKIGDFSKNSTDTDLVNRTVEDISSSNIEAPNQDLPVQSTSSSTPRIKSKQMKDSPNARHKAVNKVTPFGGSAAAVRKELILDIVRRCGGVFPGDRELWYAFATIWVQQSRGIKPDPKTVRKTKKTLIDTSKLQQFTFTFENKYGITATKQIIAQVGISASDVLVKNLQEKMIANDPRVYFPEEIQVDPTLTISHHSTRKDTLPKTHTGSFQVDTEKVQYHYTPITPTQSKPRKKIMQTQSDPALRDRPESMTELRGRNSTNVTSPTQEQDLSALIDPTLSSHSKHIQDSHTNSKKKRKVFKKDLTTKPLFTSQASRVSSLMPTYQRDKNHGAVPGHPIQSPAWMVQGHIFHPSTGTFSTLLDYIGNAPPSFNPTIQSHSPRRQQERHSANEASPIRNSLDQAELVESTTSNAVSQHASITSGEDGQTKRKVPRSGPKGRVARLASSMKTPKHFSVAHPTINDTQAFKRIRLRNSRARTVLPPGGDRRIFIASVMVRCLAGGVDQALDWTLLAKIFEPEWDQAFLKQRWSWIRERFKPVSEKLQSDFQEAFVQAYKEGVIPPINYDNLKEYDWKWLHQWTMSQLSTPQKSGSELPRSRGKLEALYQVKDQCQHDMIEYFEAKGVATIPRRYSIIHNHPFIIPLASSISADIDIDDFALAKNWVRANVVTPQTTYSPDFARTKLLSIGDANLSKAVRELLQTKLISQENKGRAVPGRTFDISDYFISRLKLNLEVTHLRQAAAYKRHLDGVFQADGKSMFSFLAADGDMLALMNLIASGRLRIRQKNVPDHEHGLMDDGYRTRQIDKERLHFTVEIEPSGTYREGNPLLPLPERPRCTATSNGATIFPAWVDINGDMVPVIWDLVLAAVLGALAIRPGTNAIDLAPWMKPSLEAFEVHLLMAWLVDARVATWTDGSMEGVRLEEWWWMALDEEMGDDQL